MDDDLSGTTYEEYVEYQRSQAAERSQEEVAAELTRVFGDSKVGDLEAAILARREQLRVEREKALLKEQVQEQEMRDTAIAQFRGKLDKCLDGDMQEALGLHFTCDVRYWNSGDEASNARGIFKRHGHRWTISIESESSWGPTWRISTDGSLSDGYCRYDAALNAKLLEMLAEQDNLDTQQQLKDTATAITDDGPVYRIIEADEFNFVAEVNHQVEYSGVTQLIAHFQPNNRRCVVTRTTTVPTSLDPDDRTIPVPQQRLDLSAQEMRSLVIAHAAAEAHWRDLAAKRKEAEGDDDDDDDGGDLPF